MLISPGIFGTLEKTADDFYILHLFFFAFGKHVQSLVGVQEKNIKDKHLPSIIRPIIWLFGKIF